MKTIRVVAAVVKAVDERGEQVILATQRGYGDFKGMWEFPGGKIEDGESPEEALKREMKEELCVKVDVLDQITTVEHDYPKFHLSMDCFWCNVSSGHLTLNEADAARWLSLNALRTVNWLPADIAVVEAIEKLTGDL